MFPEICRRWCEVAGLYVEMAVRERDREPDEQLQRAADIELRELSKATRLERTLIGTFAERLQLSLDEELAAWTLVAAHSVPTLASRVEALSGTRDLTCGAIASVASHRSATT